MKYARIVNGQPVLVDFEEAYKNVSFPSSGVPESFLVEKGLVSVEESLDTDVDVEKEQVVVADPFVENGKVKTYRAELIPFVQIRENYTAAIYRHFDRTAEERGYRDYVDCMLRVGYASPRRAEAVVFAQWVDTCLVQGRALVLAARDDPKTLPKIVDFLSQLPRMEWPS